MRRIIILLLILPTATAQIEITEIMYDLPGADGKREWIEIHNAGNETDISGWRFFENGQHHKFKNFTDNLILATDEYVVIANKPEAFLNDTNFTGKIIDSSWSSLANSGEPLVLR
ncbi:MAG: lamin tail domain-containing protein, partial [Candidatus Nanoarchaeia archaeon]|nr:lamin tail domain-containing protein [Candidatus Nanoarchaeia archaeon]